MKTTVDQLASSMGQVIPIAASLGVDINQLGASYAILTANGISTSEAGTKMKAMFDELGKSGTDVSDILIAQTGKSFKELTAEGKSTGDVLDILKQYADESCIGLNELFGSSEAGSAALILAKDGAAGFNEQLNGMVNSTGAAADAFAKVSDTFSEKCNKLKERFKEVGIRIGESLIDIIEEKALPVIEKFADWLGNLDDAQIDNIANLIEWGVKLGAAITIVGKLTSGVGSLFSAFKTVSGVIKTVSGLFGLASSAAGGLTSAVGGIAGAASGAAGSGGLGALASGLAGLPGFCSLASVGIAGLIGAVGGIAYAIYDNRKAIKEGEEQFDNLGIAAEDFTGRIRTEESIWTEIFGKEYSIKFSDDYKEKTKQIEKDFEDFKNNLGTTSDRINEIMANTNLTPSQKKEEISNVWNEAIEETETKLGILNNTVETSVQDMNYGEYLAEELHMPEDLVDKSLNDYYEWFNERKKTAKEALEEQQRIYAEASKQHRDLTKEEKEEIEKLEEEYGTAIADLAATNGEDIYNVMQEWAGKQQRTKKENYDKELDDIKTSFAERKKVIDENYEEQRKKIENNMTLSQEEKDAWLSNLNEMQNAEQQYNQFYETSMKSRAIYDKEWAEENGLATEKILDNEGNVIGEVIKDGDAIVNAYMDNTEAAKQWAEDHGYKMEEIKDAYGNTVTAITDNGEIIGSVVDLKQVYSDNFGNISEILKNYTTGTDGVALDSETAFQRVKTALANGEIDYKQFGAISEEAFLQMAAAAINGQETLDYTGDALQQTYENNKAKIQEFMQANQDLTQVVYDENGNQQISYEDTMAAISTAVDEGRINIGDYGATTKDEFLKMAEAAIRNRDSIEGSISGLQTVYENYRTKVEETMQGCIVANEDGSTNVEQTMSNIKTALDNGQIDLSNFGNVSKEEFLKMAEAAANGSGYVDEVTEKLFGLNGSDFKANLDTTDVEEAEKKTGGFIDSVKNWFAETFGINIDDSDLDEAQSKEETILTLKSKINGETVTINVENGQIKNADEVLQSIDEKKEKLNSEITELKAEQSQLDKADGKYWEIQSKIDEINKQVTVLNTDEEQVKQLIKDQETIDDNIQYLNRSEVKVKTNNDNIKKTQDEEDKAQKKAHDLSNYSIKPKSDTNDVERVGKEADTSKRKLEATDNTKVSPDSNTNNIKAVGDVADDSRGKVEILGGSFAGPEVSFGNLWSLDGMLDGVLSKIGRVASNVWNGLWGNANGTEYQNDLDMYACGTESVKKIKKYAVGSNSIPAEENDFVPFIAGEQGQELVAAPVGSKVYTHRATRSGNVGSNSDLLQDSNPPVIKIFLDGKELTKSVAKYITTEMNGLSRYRKNL